MANRPPLSYREEVARTPTPNQTPSRHAGHHPVPRVPAKTQRAGGPVRLRRPLPRLRRRIHRRAVRRAAIRPAGAGAGTAAPQRPAAGLRQPRRRLPLPPATLRPGLRPALLRLAPPPRLDRADIGRPLPLLLLDRRACLVLGIIALVMASTDLSQMDPGQMDPSGRAATKSGQLCAIIGLIVSGVFLLSCCGIYFVAFTLAPGTGRAAAPRAPAGSWARGRRLRRRCRPRSGRPTIRAPAIGGAAGGRPTVGGPSCCKSVSASATSRPTWAWKCRAASSSARGPASATSCWRRLRRLRRRHDGRPRRRRCPVHHEADRGDGPAADRRGDRKSPPTTC